MCVEDGKAVRTPVRLGRRQGNWVEVLKKQTHPAHNGEPAVWEEFTGEEKIVASGPSELTDGQTVSVQARPNGIRLAAATIP